MMMNENHNGYRSVVAASELKNLSFGLSLHSDLTTQISSHRTVGRGGQVKMDNS